MRLPAIDLYSSGERDFRLSQPKNIWKIITTGISSIKNAVLGPVTKHTQSRGLSGVDHWTQLQRLKRSQGINGKQENIQLKALCMRNPKVRESSRTFKDQEKDWGGSRKGDKKKNDMNLGTCLSGGQMSIRLRCRQRIKSILYLTWHWKDSSFHQEETWSSIPRSLMHWCKWWRWRVERETQESTIATWPPDNSGLPRLVIAAVNLERKGEIGGKVKIRTDSFPMTRVGRWDRWNHYTTPGSLAKTVVEVDRHSLNEGKLRNRLGKQETKFHVDKLWVNK